MLRYVSAVISDAVVGFLSYWPAWMTMIMLFIWAKIAAWRTGRVRISVESDGTEYYRARRRVILPVVLLIAAFILTAVFVTLVTKGVFSFTWYDFSLKFGIPDKAAEILLFFGAAICAGIWSVCSLVIFLILIPKKDKYAERRAALISFVAAAVVCLILLGVGFAVRSNISRIIASFEENPVLPLW